MWKSALIGGGASVVASVAAIVFWGPGFGSSDSAAASTVPALIARWSRENDACSGGSGNDPETFKACDRRGEVDTLLERAGWCFGEGVRPGDTKKWKPCLGDPSNPAGPPEQSDQRAWYSEGSDHTGCIISKGPADRMEQLRLVGEEPSVSESRDAAGNLKSVEVARYINYGLQSVVWTYYRNKSDCEARAASQAIPDEYR